MACQAHTCNAARTQHDQSTQSTRRAPSRSERLASRSRSPRPPLTAALAALSPFRPPPGAMSDDAGDDGEALGRTMTCIVCLRDDINTVEDCGLRLACGHWQCERCSNTLVKRCAICHRGHLNTPKPCYNCGTRKVMYQSRTCDVCERPCCVSCSTPSECCVDNDGVVCVHARCGYCVACGLEPE